MAKDFKTPLKSLLPAVQKGPGGHKGHSGVSVGKGKKKTPKGMFAR